MSQMVLRLPRTLPFALHLVVCFATLKPRVDCHKSLRALNLIIMRMVKFKRTLCQTARALYPTSRCLILTSHTLRLQGSGGFQGLARAPSLFLSLSRALSRSLARSLWPSCSRSLARALSLHCTLSLYLSLAISLSLYIYISISLSLSAPLSLQSAPHRAHSPGPPHAPSARGFVYQQAGGGRA